MKSKYHKQQTNRGSGIQVTSMLCKVKFLFLSMVSGSDKNKNFNELEHEKIRPRLKKTEQLSFNSGLNTFLVVSKSSVYNLICALKIDG